MKKSETPAAPTRADLRRRWRRLKADHKAGAITEAEFRKRTHALLLEANAALAPEFFARLGLTVERRRGRAVLLTPLVVAPTKEVRERLAQAMLEGTPVRSEDEGLSRRVRQYCDDILRTGLALKRGRRAGATPADAIRSKKVDETIAAVYAARKFLREEADRKSRVLEGAALDRAAREKVARETGVPLNTVVRRWRMRHKR